MLEHTDHLEHCRSKDKLFSESLGCLVRHRGHQYNLRCSHLLERLERSLDQLLSDPTSTNIFINPDVMKACMRTEQHSPVGLFERAIYIPNDFSRIIFGHKEQSFWVREF